MKKIVLLVTVFAALASGSLAVATTYHTINVNGDISDFDVATERIYDDSTSDCIWDNNEIDDLYLTWDQNALYIGVTFKLEEANSISMYLDFSLGDGAHDLGTVAWKKFFYTEGWLANFSVNVSGDRTDGIFRIYGDNSHDDYSDRSEIVTGTVINPDRTGAYECKIPWTTIYRNGFPPGATMGIVATLTGFRGYDGADAAPDQTVNPNGDGQYDILDIVKTINLDANGDGIPEADWNPKDNVGPGGSPPIVEASAEPTSGAAPLCVSFEGVGFDPDGGDVTYLWNFGDGATETVAVTSHCYNNPGVYNAQLTVTDDENDQTSAPGITITVTDPAADPSLQLRLSQEQPNCFTAGQLFDLRVNILNPGNSIVSADLYVLLDVFGEYFFYPGWGSGMNKDSVSVAAASDYSDQILTFSWPETGSGRVEGVVFHAAIFTPGSFNMIGDGYDSVVFCFE